MEDHLKRLYALVDEFKGDQTGRHTSMRLSSAVKSETWHQEHSTFTPSDFGEYPELLILGLGLFWHS